LNRHSVVENDAANPRRRRAGRGSLHGVVGWFASVIPVSLLTAEWLSKAGIHFATEKDREMKLVAVAFLAAISVSACKQECIGFPGCAIDVKFTDDAWRVSGEVVDADTGQPLPHQVVQFLQLERRPRWCSFCQIHGRNFYVIADERGRFYFSGQISGQLDVTVDPPNKDGHCSKSYALGEIGKQRLNLKFALKRGPCPMIL
jgi:hypothetical protein